MFACWCGGGGGGGDGGGDGGSGDGGGGGGGDFGREQCFHGLFMEFSLEVGCLLHFPTGMVGTFWSRNAPVLLYYTGTKYPSTLTSEMQTIFKQVGLFIKCPVNIKKMKSFVVGHGFQPPVDVQDLVVM